MLGQSDTDMHHIFKGSDTAIVYLFLHVYLYVNVHMITNKLFIK